MKKGKYRFIVQHTVEVHIQITDEAQFRQNFDAWRQLGDPGDEVTELDYLHSRARIRNAGKYKGGFTLATENEHTYVEAIPTCRHCGCTEDDACSLSTGPCSWVADDLCSNPYCIALRRAETEKEVQHG